MFEALVLAAIFFERHAGEIKPSALAEAFQTTRGNVSHCISSLEAKGLVERRIDPEDARALQLVLKPQGGGGRCGWWGFWTGCSGGLRRGIGVAKLEAMLEQMGAVEELCAGMAGDVEAVAESTKRHSRMILKRRRCGIVDCPMNSGGSNL